LANDEGGSTGACEVRGYRVSGRVQGVGFRWWTQDRAESLGLSGSVWNRRDGTVEVCAAGDGPALDALERALASGPLGARVAAVVRVEPNYDPAQGPFRIERRA
jgi:acylphosphatase